MSGNSRMGSNAPILWSFLVASALMAACATAGPLSVSPGEIPSLEAGLQQDPANPDLLHRYAAALFADGQCDRAVPAAERARSAQAANAVGPLVIGQCLEEAGSYDQALEVYGDYLAEHGDAGGAHAVRGREELVRRARATQVAREAIARDTLLSSAVDPDAVGVLPLMVEGDPTYQPLSRGLAAIITTDLALLNRFPLVERVQLQALMAEQQLSETQQVEPETAARMGRMVQAGRLLQGLVVIPPTGETHMESNVVRETGEVLSPEIVRGPLETLMDLEKDLVIRLVSSLGYQLTEAERQRILESGTRNLLAFLAFSRGIMAEDRGDYAQAVFHYSEAIQLDPGFTEARRRLEIAVAIGEMQGLTRGEITQVAFRVEDAVGGAVLGGSGGGGRAEGNVEDNALANTIGDIASTQSERATQNAGTGDGGREINQLITTTVLRPELPIQTLLRIVLRIP